MMLTVSWVNDHWLIFIMITAMMRSRQSHFCFGPSASEWGGGTEGIILVTAATLLKIYIVLCLLVLHDVACHTPFTHNYGFRYAAFNCAFITLSKLSLVELNYFYVLFSHMNQMSQSHFNSAWLKPLHSQPCHFFGLKIKRTTRSCVVGIENVDVIPVPEIEK